MLEVNQIDVFYGKIHAVWNLSLEVKRSTVVALLGANGAGKTTTLKAISGLLPVNRGEIKFEGRVIHSSPADQRVKMGICHVLEGREIFPLMTTLENLEMGAYLRRDRTEIEKDLEKVYCYFPVLQRREHQDAGTLSGGEQQMLAIARALMSRPNLLLLDEPSLGLAPVLVEEIFSIIAELKKEGTTILLVEQNANMAFCVSDYCYILETGKLALSGLTDMMKTNEKVKQSYLGFEE